jgi:hypothetical protein
MDGKSKWYRVRLTSGDGIGYVAASQVVVRSFQIETAFNRVKALKKIADLDNTTRIANYNNAAGKAPTQPGGKSVDSLGNSRDQSAPAYISPDTASAFTYAPDGTLCMVMGTVGNFVEAYFPGWDEVRYVPSKSPKGKSYLVPGDPVSTLTQAIVVDRKNENVMVFEYDGSQWNIVSMCFVSTGKKGGAYQPTPLGDFFTEKHVGKSFSTSPTARRRQTPRATRNLRVTRPTRYASRRALTCTACPWERITTLPTNLLFPEEPRKSTATSSASIPPPTCACATTRATRNSCTAG